MATQEELERWERIAHAEDRERAIKAKQRFKAHKVMTPEEYAAMAITGWHQVCRDFDGAGNVGVRFLSSAIER